jgi:monovalent cation/hydrogen antiporter
VLERVGGIETVATTMVLPVFGVVAAVTVARFASVFGSDAVLALMNRVGVTAKRPLGPRAATVGTRCIGPWQLCVTLYSKLRRR